MASSSCVRLAAIHQQLNFGKSKTMLSSPKTYAQANLTSPLRASCSFPKTLLITGQKHKLQTLHYKHFTYSATTTSKSSTICTATSSCENTSSSENTPGIPVAEICILVLVYIIPFLNRLNLLSKFPVLEYVVKPTIPLLGFYQSIPTLCLIGFLSLFIGFVRYKNFTKFKYSLVMDSVVVIASLVRPFLVNANALAGGELGLKSQLLNVLELLGFQTCIHSCLEYLGQCLGEEKEQKVNQDEGKKVKDATKNEKEKVNEDEGKKVNEAANGSVKPSIDKIAHIMEVVLKTSGDGGRREGKSMVLKLLSQYNRLSSDVKSVETCNKYILSLCQRCLNSLLNLVEQAAAYRKVDREISQVADNLLWLLNILADRKVAEELTLMWANQKELAELHMRCGSWIPSRHLISCITARLFVCIGNGKIFPSKDTRQRLLLTWFKPLVDDFPNLRNLKSFDPKAVEENIERAILELTPNDQQSILLAWYECFLKNANRPDLRKAFETWSRGSFG